MASAASAEAQPRAMDLVPLLQPISPARKHPLADPDGRISVIVHMPAGRDAVSHAMLPIAEGMATVRLLPSDLPDFLAKHPGVALSVHPRKRTLLDESSKLIRADSARQRTGFSGRGVLVGIIDTGIDAAHDDFRDEDGKTRIAWMLDMSRMPKGELGHAALEAKFGCTDPQQSPCLVLDAAMIDAALREDTVEVPRDAVGHGSHVASIAAGDGGRGGDVKFVGVAPEATLVIARVTRATSNEMDDADIVTAARFIFDRAEAMGMPAVVNISLGGDFGPHDGSSPLELGLASLVGSGHPGRAIVVAAGNSGTLYEDANGHTFGIHTEARVVPESRIRIPLRIPFDRDGGHVKGQAYVWLGFRPGDDVTIGLEGPKGASFIDQVSRGNSAGYTSPDLSAGIIHGVESLLAPLSRGTHGAVVALDGSLESGSEIAITLEGFGTPKLWVQGGGDLGPSGGSPGILFAGGMKEGTINVPATHPDLIAVGCTLGRSRWEDASGKVRRLASFGDTLSPIADSSCFFSSAGPTATGVVKPEISAPGGFIAAAMSRDAAPSVRAGSIFEAPRGFCDEQGPCFLVDDHHALLSGTSMSAPQVTGAVALLFERDPKLIQSEITTLLQAGARRPSGAVPYDYQLGPGALDIEGMLEAYELSRARALTLPDAEASWMSLSSSYARPDPSWPVMGAVLLRTKDGAIVDDFDPSRLTLTVDNGLVRRELERIAPGLWRFEVAGREGSGQSEMHVEVRFDGEIVGSAHPSLHGSRTLPIGVDKWVATGELEAGGGCSTSPGTRGPWGAWAFLAALSTAVVVHRRTKPRGFYTRFTSPMG